MNIKNQIFNGDMNPADHRAYFFKIDTTIKKIRYSLQKRFDEAKMDITVDQWTLIDHIYRHEGISQNSLAEMTVKDAPTVTRILDLLIKKGLAERQMSEEDRRRFNIYLTKKGEAKFEKALPIVIEVRRKGWGDMTEEEYLAFTKVLDTIYRNITDDE